MSCEAGLSLILAIGMTNYLLINHLICIIPDTEQIVILILHYLIIQKLKNVICSKLFPYGTANQIRLKIALQVYVKKTN